MHTQTEITVYWSDCDPMGHANNAKYFTYMEQGRVDLFRQMFDLQKDKPIDPSHFPFILAEISCRFLKPLYVDETIVVHTRVTEIKNSSFIIEYELKDKITGAVVATGRSAQVWYDYKIGKPIPIPEKYRKILCP